MKSKLFSILALVLTGFTAIAAEKDNAALKLKPGEQYALTIQGIPVDEKNSIDGLYRVDANGGISIPFVGRVQVGGLTVEEAQKTMEKTLKERGIYNFPKIRLMQSKEVQPQQQKKAEG